MAIPRFAFALIALLAALALPCGAARAQDWPTRPVKIIVPFPPGQGADIIARLLSDKLSTALGQRFIVENHPGSGSMLGTALVAKAPADGYTLLIAGTSAMVINPFLFPDPGYDTLRDFAPITNAAGLPMVLVVNPNSRFKDLGGLISYARANPGKVTYGSAGNGSAHHLVVARFAKEAGLQLTHVPYKGSAAAMTDLVGGNIDMLADTLPAVMPFVKSGKIRPLAISSKERSVFAPDVPTLAEQGLPGFEAIAWSGLVAPRKTPAPILDKLSVEVRKILRSPEMEKTFQQLSMIPIADSRAEFENFIKAELVTWGAAVKSSNARVD